LFKFSVHVGSGSGALSKASRHNKKDSKKAKTHPLDYGQSHQRPLVDFLISFTRTTIMSTPFSTTHLFTLAGRVALVTGGYRGIGRMIATGFLQQGAKVYICGRKALECDTAAKELAAYGECISLPCDISRPEGVADLVARFKQHESKLDILVNNAGAAWAEPFAEFPEKGWDKVVDLNMKTPFFLTQALYAELKTAAAAAAQLPGSQLAKVINVASIDGVSVNPMETYSYAASKAGLIHLTRRMALRLAADGIAVSAIAPGAFASDMNTVARDHAAETAKRIPAQRIGSAEDMAGAAIYLASRAGDYVMGSTLMVDGGVTHARG
jgi:NAD(P)-dependent dehydrogenase (short-subunit alcohol dehydrogenase family)